MKQIDSSEQYYHNLNFVHCKIVINRELEQNQINLILWGWRIQLCLEINQTYTTQDFKKYDPFSGFNEWSVCSQFT